MRRLPPLVRRWTAAVLGFLLSVIAYLGVAYFTGSQWGAVIWIIFLIPACVRLMDRLLVREAPAGPHKELAGA